MRVLVTGATGFVGQSLVPALVEAGHEVCVLVRDVVQYETPDGVAVFEGDLLDPWGADAALDGVDAAYYLIHSMGSGSDFREQDRRAAHNFERAASRAGVARVIYLGGLGEDRDNLSAHLRSRREVELILREGDYDLTTLRAAIIVGDGSASFEMVRQLAARLPVMITPRWVNTKCQPIAVDDVIAYLVSILSVPETAGETYEIGGPDVLTYREVLERTADIQGHELTIIQVPVLTPTLSAYWLDFVTDVPASVAHPLIHGMKNTVVVTDHRIEDLVSVPGTPFDEAVEKALGVDAVEVGDG